MEYIVHRRFKSKTISGEVNLPVGTVCEEIDGHIFFNNKLLCYVESENAHQFFARNNDSNGLLRGKFTQNIQNSLSKRDNNYQERWDKVWSDPICQTYKREEFSDFWIWNHEFFQADVKILKYIVNLIEIKEDK